MDPPYYHPTETEGGAWEGRTVQPDLTELQAQSTEPESPAWSAAGRKTAR